MVEKEIIKAQDGNIAVYRNCSGPKTVLLLRGDGGGRPSPISGFVTLSEEDCEEIYRMMV